MDEADIIALYEDIMNAAIDEAYERGYARGYTAGKLGLYEKGRSDEHSGNVLVENGPMGDTTSVLRRT